MESQFAIHPEDRGEQARKLHLLKQSFLGADKHIAYFKVPKIRSTSPGKKSGCKQISNHITVEIYTPKTHNILQSPAPSLATKHPHGKPSSPPKTTRTNAFTRLAVFAQMAASVYVS
jgi:hypothetical protein